MRPGGTMALQYGVGAAPRQRDDFYTEPIAATRALLAVEEFAGSVWDPACGTGNILRAVSECRGYAPAFMRYRAAPDPLQLIISPAVPIGTDLRTGLDFLNDLEVGAVPVDNIICNPPYKHAEAFARQALACARHKVALFLRLQFLEGLRWDDLELAGRLDRVWVFQNRIGMVRDGVAYKGGMTAHAWFVWNQLHQVGTPWTGGWLKCVR